MDACKSFVQQCMFRKIQKLNIINTSLKKMQTGWRVLRIIISNLSEILSEVIYYIRPIHYTVSL